MKNSTRVQTALRLGLCAATAALGLVNWWVLNFEPAPSPATRHMVLASVTAVPASLSPSDDRPLSEFDEIVQRPIFTASRRPFVPSEPTSREAQRILPPPDMRLIGVAIDASRKQALLRTAQQPRGRWVAQGESIDGWQVQSVRGDAAILASGKQTHELRLYPTQTPNKQNR